MEIQYPVSFMLCKPCLEPIREGNGPSFAGSIVEHRIRRHQAPQTVLSFPVPGAFTLLCYDLSIEPLQVTCIIQ